MAINSCMLRPKCRQPYIHNSAEDDESPISSHMAPPALPPLPPPPVESADAVLSRELEKQQKLSDWYYIKSNPKSPRLPPRPEKRTTGPASSGPVKSASVTRFNSVVQQQRDCTGRNNSIKRDRIIGVVADKTNHCDVVSTESREHSVSQISNKTNLWTGEKFNGFPLAGQQVERQQPLYDKQQPIYQRLQHPPQQNQNEQSSYVQLAGRDHDNRQITPNIHQFPQHPNYSPISRGGHNNNNNNVNHNVNVNKLATVHQSPTALARFGELTSSSFEHVNVSSFLPEMSAPEKQFRSTSNFTNEHDLADGRRLKAMPMPPRRRAVPPIPSQNQTVS